MSIKTMIFGIAAVAAVALPGAASAQSWGNYGYGNGGGYYGQSYGYRGDDRFDRRERHRWEQQRRWEEKQRRREWQRAHRHDRQYDRGYYRY